MTLPVLTWSRGAIVNILSQTMADSWHSGAAKVLERQNAALAQAAPVP